MLTGSDKTRNVDDAIRAEAGPQRVLRVTASRFVRRKLSVILVLYLMDESIRKSDTAATKTDSTDVALNKAQVAGRLNISLRTLENWMAEGDIPYWKCKKVVRFYWPDVEEHLRRRLGVGYPPGVTAR